MKLTIKVPKEYHKYVFVATCVDYNKMCDIVLAQVKTGGEYVPISMLHKEPVELCFNLQNEQQRIKARSALQNLFYSEVYVHSETTKTAPSSQMEMTCAYQVIDKMYQAGIQYLEFVR